MQLFARNCAHKCCFAHARARAHADADAHADAHEHTHASSFTSLHVHNSLNSMQFNSIQSHAELNLQIDFTGFPY